MPLYPIACSCGFRGDAFAKVAELQDGRVKCPECGVHAEQEYARKTVASGNREFRGDAQESVTEGWHPDEVGRVQREMTADGDHDAANCIRSDGSVWFKNRQEQQRYMRAKTRIWSRKADGPGESPAEVQAKAEAGAAKRRAKMIGKSGKPERAIGG